jgi:hypothetical protein
MGRNAALEHHRLHVRHRLVAFLANIPLASISGSTILSHSSVVRHTATPFNRVKLQRLVVGR